MLVAAAVIAGLLLRFAGLDARSLWGDEIVNLTVAMGHSWYPWQGEESEPFYGADHYREMVAHAPEYYSGRVGALLRMNDQIPPLYYILLNFWIHLFGTSEAALRSLSLLASTATIPLLYLLGRALASRDAGVYGAWIFALAPFHVAFGVYNRPYAWLCFFAVLSTLAAVHVSRGARGAWLATYTVAAALGLYTHYLFVWNILFHVLLVLFYRRDDRAALLRFGVTCAIVAIGFLFWLPTFLAQIQWSRELRHQSWFYWYSGQPSLLEMATSLGRNFMLLLTAGSIRQPCEPGGSACPVDPVLTAVFYAVPLLMFGLSGWHLLRYHAGRTGRESTAGPDPWTSCLLWGTCVFLGPVLSDLLLDSHMVQSHRYFIAASGPAYIAVAMAVAGTSRRPLRWSLGAGLLLFLLAGSGLYLRGSATALIYEISARDAARYLDDQSAGASDLVLVLDPGINPMDFAYYLGTNPDFARVRVPARHLEAPGVAEQLRAITAARPRARIWYVDDHGPEQTAHAAVLDWLRTRYDEVETRAFTNVDLHLFSARRQPGRTPEGD